MKLIMKYDGVLQSWYPALEHPSVFTSMQQDAWRTFAMTLYGKLSRQIWPTAGSLRERHVAIYQNSRVYRFNGSVFPLFVFCMYSSGKTISSVTTQQFNNHCSSSITTTVVHREQTTCSCWENSHKYVRCFTTLVRKVT